MRTLRGSINTSPFSPLLYSFNLYRNTQFSKIEFAAWKYEDCSASFGDVCEPETSPLCREEQHRKLITCKVMSGTDRPPSPRDSLQSIVQKPTIIVRMISKIMQQYQKELIAPQYFLSE
jgi:hypothetical protein